MAVTRNVRFHVINKFTCWSSKYCTRIISVLTQWLSHFCLVRMTQQHGSCSLGTNWRGNCLKQGGTRFQNVFHCVLMLFLFVVQVKDLYMHPELFTIENGLLTPTLKAKRADLKKLFQPQIDSLYASMEWLVWGVEGGWSRARWATASLPVDLSVNKYCTFYGS